MSKETQNSLRAADGRSWRLAPLGSSEGLTISASIVILLPSWRDAWQAGRRQPCGGRHIRDNQNNRVGWTLPQPVEYPALPPPSVSDRPLDVPKVEAFRRQSVGLFQPVVPDGVIHLTPQRVCFPRRHANSWPWAPIGVISLARPRPSTRRVCSCCNVTETLQSRQRFAFSAISSSSAIAVPVFSNILRSMTMASSPGV